MGIKEISVPRDADAAAMEQARLDLEATLNECMRRAYQIVGRPDACPPPVTGASSG